MIAPPPHSPPPRVGTLFARALASHVVASYAGVFALGAVIESGDTFTLRGCSILLIAPLTSLWLAVATAWALTDLDHLPPGALTEMAAVWGAYAVVFAAVFWRTRGWHPSAPPGRWCGRCGYDLTGNVSGVCPECGTVVTPNEAGS